MGAYILMNTEELRPLTKRIFTYFNKRALSENQVDIWAKELGYIPSETSSYIYKNIIKHDKLPANVPKCIKGIYHQWRTENPDRTAYTKEECEYCNGSGGLYFQIKGYDFMCRCGHCQNWRGSWGENAAAIYTTYKTQEMGGKVL